MVVGSSANVALRGSRPDGHAAALSMQRSFAVTPGNHQHLQRRRQKLPALQKGKSSRPGPSRCSHRARQVERVADADRNNAARVAARRHGAIRRATPEMRPHRPHRPECHRLQRSSITRERAAFCAERCFLRLSHKYRRAQFIARLHNTGLFLPSRYAAPAPPARTVAAASAQTAATFRHARPHGVFVPPEDSYYSLRS